MLQVAGRWALLVLPSLFLGCDVGSECQPIECEDGVWVVAAPSATWQAGAYELEVTHDGQIDTCVFSLPDDVPTSALETVLDCGGAVFADLEALSDCTDCSLDSKFQLDLHLSSLPKELSVTLTRDGETVVKDQRSVEYQDVYPRGQACGGGCTQSHFELVADGG